MNDHNPCLILFVSLMLQWQGETQGGVFLATEKRAQGHKARKRIQLNSIAPLILPCQPDATDVVSVEESCDGPTSDGREPRAAGGARWRDGIDVKVLLPDTSCLVDCCFHTWSHVECWIFAETHDRLLPILPISHCSRYLGIIRMIEWNGVAQAHFPWQMTSELFLGFYLGFCSSAAPRRSQARDVGLDVCDVGDETGGTWWLRRSSSRPR